MSTETDDRPETAATEPRVPTPEDTPEAEDRGANGHSAAAEVAPPAASRPGKLGLADTDSLHRALSTAFADVIGYAGSMVGEADLDPSRAVHEYRKSLRRARSLVKLLAGALGEEAATELTDTLRRAQRATSDLRDGDVLRSRLAGLSDEKGWRKVVPELAQGLDSPEHGAAYARSVLQMGAGLIDGLPARFDQALPADVGWDAVNLGLADSYRRARARLARARKSDDAEALHDFRKRAKELTYQVEMLAAGQRGALRRQQRGLARLSEKLGDITDLMLLRAHLQAAAVTGGLDKRRRKLSRRLDRTIRRRTGKALSRGRELFSSGSKKFARKLVERRRPAPAGGEPDAS